MFGSQSATGKPVQLYHLGNSRVQCHLMQPDEPLRRGIYYYWHISVDEGKVDLEVIPDNAVDLVMSADEPGFSSLYFPVAERFSIPLHGPVCYVGVCFKFDQLSRYFSQPLEQLRSVPEGLETTALLDLQPVLDQLTRLGDLPEIKTLLDGVFFRFAERQSNFGESQGPLDMANVITAMQQTLGDTGMSELAARFDLSERQFRRVLTDTFGFGPKKVQRVVRLQLVLAELMRTESGEILDGYYDEAHRIKELRSLTGMTPGEIRRMAEIYNQSD